MSEPIDNPIPPDEDVIPLPWWIVAGIVDALGKELNIGFKRAAQLPNGFTAAVLHGDAILGQISVTGDEQKTTVAMEDLQPGASDYWGRILGFLIRASNAVAVHQRRTWPTTADGAIEHYYRSKARGSRISLKDVAEMTGFSEAYLRKRKVSYDRDGKWGSKGHVRGHIKTND